METMLAVHSKWDGMQKSFSGYKMLFPGLKKIVIDIFGGQRGSHQLFNCFCHFGRSKAARVGFNGRRHKKQARKQQKAAAHKTGKTVQNRKKAPKGSANSSKLHKQQRAPNSSNT